MLAPVSATTRGQMGQAAGTVADRGDDARQPAVRGQADLDHAAENQRIDVAAAEQQRDALAAQLGQLAR